MTETPEFMYYLAQHECGEWHILDAHGKILSEHKTQQIAMDALDSLAGTTEWSSEPIKEEDGGISRAMIEKRGQKTN